jgi:hypothetical protein
MVQAWLWRAYIATVTGSRAYTFSDVLGDTFMMMKRVLCLLAVCLPLPALSQTVKGPTTLRGVLLQQIRTVHTEKDWFVTETVAVEGLTAEQANWTDGSGNHSIGQLVTHLVFWNSQDLAKFEGKEPQKFDGKNDETFTAFDSKQWKETTRQLDEVLTEWEKAIEAADEKKLQAWAATIDHIGMHNAYHIGQIVYVRKAQKSWDATKGVQ